MSVWGNPLHCGGEYNDISQETMGTITIVSGGNGWGHIVNK